MDYCSSCRRHLNGALVCPGCGAYAPDIAPPLAGAPVPPAGPAVVPPDVRTDGGPAAGAMTAGARVWEPDPGPDRAHPAAVDSDGGDRESVGSRAPGDADDPMPALAQGGRAARRRQLARWKKSHRRAVVATAVALVGGGLTFASMDRGSSGAGRAEAATTPDETSMGGVSGEATGDTPGADGRAGSPSGSSESSASPGSPESAKSSKGAAGSAAGDEQRTGSAAGDGSPRAGSSREESVSVGRGTSRGPVPGAGTRTESASGSPSGSTGTGTGTGNGTGGDSGKPSTPPSSSPSQQPSSPPAAQEPSSGSGSGSADPTEDPTSPSQLCLLVVCLG